MVFERFITALVVQPCREETPAATRERVREAFPPGATRRMTQLGMLVGHCLANLAHTPDGTLIYASAFGESRALEDYLASFPEASPTGFQTSVHPSGAQQGLIARRLRCREVFPLSGLESLGGEALLAACLAPGPEAVVAGGDERAGWLTERGVASDTTHAFGLVLAREPGPAPLAVLRLRSTDAESVEGIDLAALNRMLAERTDHNGPACAGWELDLRWHRAS